MTGKPEGLTGALWKRHGGGDKLGSGGGSCPLSPEDGGVLPLPHRRQQLTQAGVRRLWGVGIADVQGVRVVDQLAGDGNVDRSLLLVTRDDPYLHPWRQDSLLTAR